jgi:hypothetical protein
MISNPKFRYGVKVMPEPEPVATLEMVPVYQLPDGRRYLVTFDGPDGSEVTFDNMSNDWESFALPRALYNAIIKVGAPPQESE